MRQRKSDRLVLNRCGTPVQLTHRYLEFLVVGLCQVAQNTKGDSLAQKHRVVAVAAPVNASMQTVTEGDVVRELIQFAVYRHQAAVGAGIAVGKQRQSVTCGDFRIREDGASVIKELEHSDACSAHCAMTGWICRMGWRALGKCLRKQIASILVEAFLHSH